MAIPVTLEEVWRQMVTDIGGSQSPDSTLKQLMLAFASATMNIPPITLVPTPTGIIATDTANIQSAITAAQTANPYGGTVQLQAGKYAVSSTGLTSTTIGNSGGTATGWTYSGTAPTVGQYVLSTGQGNNAIPQILTVGVGTFTTDIAPSTTIASSTVAWFITPAVTLPPGIKLKGAGGAVGLRTANSYESLPLYCTGIIDYGTGITVVSRGGNGTSARYGLYDMAVWANGIWSSGTSATALGGVIIGNASLMFEADNVDCNYYKTFGYAADGNINQVDLRNCGVQFIGNSNATNSTGAFLVSLFNSTASESLNLYNCMCSDVYGMGVGGGNLSGSGSVGYAQTTNIWGGQYQNVFSTSSTYSGWALVLGGNLSNMDSLVGVWCGTNANGDLWWNNGVGTAVNCTFTSQTAYVVQVWSGGTGNNLATLTLDSCQLYSGNSGTFNVNLRQGTLNWRGVDMNVGLSGAINSLVGNSNSNPGITQVTAYGTGTATTNSYNGTIGVSASAVGQSSGQGYLAMYDSGASAMRYVTVHSGTVTVASSVPT